ncbi:hypothetical protein DL763_000754 [Monosporascus cannonballus]|nr:hypothetical protein DL763_000754 [Monosporascus cannonballus]
MSASDMQWLGRERLNQYELLDCMEKAKGLVFVNKNGQKFFDGIISGLDTVPVGPLFLQQSGSLGRLMAGDPSLSWIVSTVACLFQHHRDERIVTAMLTAFIMESHRSHGQEQAVDTLDAFTYNPEQTRVRAVVRKIVSSVWYNVVNVGCDTIPLPQELLAVCTKGHYLESGDFSIVINNIYAHCPSRAILRADHLLRDVLLWILLHYSGTVVVNVGGQIVYRADLGNSRRELEVRVASWCSEDGDCGAAGKESYEILRHISGKFEEFLSGSSPRFTDVPPRPGRNVEQRTADLGEMLGSVNDAMVAGRPVVSAERLFLPGVSAEPGSQGAADQMTVSLALKRIPAMINLEWGSSPAYQVVFVGRFQAVSGSGVLDETAAWNTERRLNTLLEYFPVLSDLVTKVSANCLCSDCSGLKDRRLPEVRTNRLIPGCLKRTAVEEAFLLLAHGVADGFGASDTPSVSDVTPIVEGMAAPFLELAQERKVCWDTWFAVASCVYLDCPFEKPARDAHPTFSGTAFAAIQYGNLAAQTPWLDLIQDLAVRGCFGLVGSKGRLGVVTRRDDYHAQFRSVEEDFAIIETENTESVTSFCARNKKAASLIDHLLHVDEDESSVESGVILCQMDDKFYRLYCASRQEPIGESWTLAMC